MSPHGLRMLSIYLAGLVLLTLPFAVLGWLTWTAG